MGAGNNQQNKAGGMGSSRDSGHGSGNCCSMGAMAGRGGGMAEVMVRDDRVRDDQERGLRLSRSRFHTPQKYKEKNSNVGNFALRNSYVKCVLKLNWRGWRGSYLSLLQLQSSPELSGALQSIPCSHFSFHLSTPC